MKYCIHCGKEINETAGFCSYCGKKQAKTTENKDGGETEKLSAEKNAWEETAKEKGAEVSQGGVDAVQGSVKAAKEAGSRMGNPSKYLKVVIPIAILCIVIIAAIGIGKAVMRGSHSSDEEALKEIIADQKAMGATINEKNGAWYEWNEDGRLVGISWNGCSLNGSISFSELTCLERLDCGDNQLSSLDVSSCKKLKELYCEYNQLGKLDVSECNELKILSCNDNSLGALDVEKCTSLRTLSCDNNKLKSLDVSNCGKLESLDCDKNVKISGCNVGIIHYDE